MLPSENRLFKKSDFEKVKKEGKLLSGELFGILVLKNQEKNSRFGFIVSSKISPKAVLRNKVKRLLRETVRKLLPEIKRGYDFLFLAKKKMVEAGLLEATDECRRLLGKADLTVKD